MPLLGMQDEDTAGAFRRRRENWTADETLFILAGNIGSMRRALPAEVSTSCGQNGNMEAVSYGLSAGKREVTEEEVAEWKERITNMMGVESVCV